MRGCCVARCRVFAPEALRRKLAGGKSARADAAPGGDWFQRICPGGAPEEIHREISPMPRRGKTSEWRLTGGGDPRGGSCPRLISYGVPPGLNGC